jgi:hypothetical protein
VQLRLQKRSQDKEFRIQNSEWPGARPSGDSGFQLPASGFWLLDSEFWILAAGLRQSAVRFG